MKNLSFYFYLIVACIFLAIVSVPLFSDGMFMDGLLYAAISNNMADGLGSFWKPYLSQSLFPEFYEHPPLALGLQSCWFYIFGDSIFVERFYSLTTYAVSGVLLVAIWKQLGQSLKTGWLPLLFWLIISNVGWACANNMLENTMTVFVLLSALFCIKGIQREKITLFILAGIFLSLALLSKGFVSLYILVIPAAWAFFNKSHSFSKVAIYTLVVVASLVLPIILLFYASEEAANNMTSYFNKQVVGSIKNVSTVDSRFAIFGEFIQHILAPLILAVLILIFSIKQKGFKIKLGTNKKMIYLFTFVIFCGIVPIMISLKQRGFYILTVYPFVGIILSLIVLPLIKEKLTQLETNEKAIIGIKVFSIFFALIVVGLSVYQFDKIGREESEIKDAYSVTQYIGKGKLLNVCPSQHGNWSKHGYFARYGQVTLVRNEIDLYDYYLVNKNDCNPLESAIYEEVPLKLIKHTLYKKK